MRSEWEELLSLLMAFESGAAAFYEASASRFASRGDLRMLWSELAQDERYHARLLEGALTAGAGERDRSGLPQLDLESVRGALDGITCHLECVERGEISSAEALAFTISLETSELVELSHAVLVDAYRHSPVLSLLNQSTTAHVNRLIHMVDRLGEPELTTILKDLAGATRKAEARCQRKILIVDDEADMLESCARIIRRGGYSCITTSNSREALALFEREHPDLLITDLRMPGLDGLELLRQAKRIDPRIPVVVFTAYVSQASAREALEAGATSYLAKPFTADQLKQTVDRALGLGEGASQFSI